MVVTGRYRPVQGSILFLYAFTSAYSLLFENIEGTTSMSVFTLAALDVWHMIILVGAVVAMVGEAVQLKTPPMLENGSQIAKLVSGLIIEIGGEFVFILGMGGYVYAILVAPDIPPARALIYIIIGLGFTGRACQAAMDVRRIRRGVAQAAKTAAVAAKLGEKKLP